MTDIHQSEYKPKPIGVFEVVGEPPCDPDERKEWGKSQKGNPDDTD